jgi:transcriptional regulator with XRE-family HTH domain
MDSVSATEKHKRAETGPYTAANEGPRLPTPPKTVVVSNKGLGERVRALRKAQEMTQASLAAAIGTQPTNISALEHGNRGITIHQVVKLAKVLNASADDILGLDPAPSKRGRRPGEPLAKRLERMGELPRSRQRALLDLVDAYLDKHSGANGRS